MNFTTAISTCLSRKYFDFETRASRSEYWFFTLFLIIVGNIIFFFPPIWFLWGVFTTIPLFSSLARRLHDVGRSGWWGLIALTGIGYLLLLFWLCTASDPNPNEYGNPPDHVSNADTKSKANPDTKSKALEILEERFARGEIDEKTYLSHKKILEGKGT